MREINETSIAHENIQADNQGNDQANQVIIKTCFIPELDKTQIKDTSILLQLIRLEVRAAKLEDHRLENYSLHDMGFVQLDTGMEIKLYFRPKEAV